MNDIDFLIQHPYFHSIENKKESEDVIYIFFDPTDSKKRYRIYMPKKNNGLFGYGGAELDFRKNPLWFQELVKKSETRFENQWRIKNLLKEGL